MIFLPNKFERYTASIRSFIHKSALKNGISRKQILILKKILIAESFQSSEPLPTDISLFSYKILYYSYFFFLGNGKRFKFKINFNGNFLIPQKAFSFLLLSVCNESSDIEILNIKNTVCIKAKNCGDMPNSNLIWHLNATIYKDIKSGDLLISIPAEKTDKKEVEYDINLSITDPFSPINIFLS
ncbi:MAG: hypothetical protein IJP34_02345 [Clostridia bacterium]|nr:hypothetical protein [Clostridia bacterium]